MRLSVCGVSSLSRYEPPVIERTVLNMRRIVSNEITVSSLQVQVWMTHSELLPLRLIVEDTSLVCQDHLKLGEESMGHVEVKVSLSNPEDRTTIDEKGLVDTGATLTVLPRKLADALRLSVRAQSKALTAGGPVSIDLSDVRLEIAGKSATMRVAISDVVDRVLIGVTTLETLGLTVDRLTSQLKESYYLLY